MEKLSIFSIILRSIWLLGSLCWNIFNILLALYPDDVKNFIGSNSIMEIYGKLPLVVWEAIAFFTFFAFFIFVLKSDKKKLISEEKKEPTLSKTNQHFGNGDIVEGDNFGGDKVYGNKYEGVKVILPDSKKKETLNKLDWHVKQVVNEVILYKVYSDKETLAKKKYNDFQDFYQNNSAEVSLGLEKLIKRISLEMRSVISQVGIFYGMKWIRDSEIASKVPFENLSPLPKIDGIEEELVNLCDRIHEEIYKELQP